MSYFSMMAELLSEGTILKGGSSSRMAATEGLKEPLLMVFKMASLPLRIMISLGKYTRGRYSVYSNTPLVPRCCGAETILNVLSGMG